MKRDFDLIRRILSDVEDAPPLKGSRDFQYQGYDDDVVTEHIELLIEAGFLDGHVSRFLGGGGSARVSRLTWAGHDFLDAMKDESIWSKAKENVLKPVGGVAFDVLLDWLKWKMREKLGLPDQ